MKNVVKPLAKSFLIPLGLTATALTADTGIHTKILKLGTTTIRTSNEEMKMKQKNEKMNLLACY